MVTPLYTLPEIALNQNNKYLTHNEALRLTEVLMGASVLSRSNNSASANEGSLYIVKPPGSGDWTGQDNKLAIAINNVWLFVTPDAKMAPFYVADENIFVRYTNSGWVAVNIAATTFDLLEDKGQLITHNGTEIAILDPESDGQTLTLDSTTPTGLKWRTLSYPSAKGQLLTHNGTLVTTLPVGTNDTVLTADSTASNGLAWKTIPAGGTIPLSAKGELLTYDGMTTITLPPGSNNQYLSANSGATSGLEWRTLPMPSAKGQLLTHNGTLVATLPVGVNDTVLTADSTAPNGIAWKTITASSSSSYKLQFASKPTNYTLSLTDEGFRLSFSGNSTLTLPSGTGFATGWQCEAKQKGTGQITFIASGGSSLELTGGSANNKLKVNNGVVSIVYAGNNTWEIVGPLDT